MLHNPGGYRMNVIYFQLLAPPLIVGGIAGMTLSVMGVDKIRELVDKANNRNHNHGQSGTLHQSIRETDHENPIERQLHNAPNRYFQEVYGLTISLVLLFVISELSTITSIVWSVVVADTCEAIYCIPEGPSYLLLIAYAILFFAICMTAYIYIMLAKTGFDQIGEIDADYVNRLLQNYP
jgi:hypothetical protein